MLFQNITHICPNCYSEISYKSFYPISSKGIYITITYGKCIIVIKKIYIYILISIVLLFGIILNYQYYTNISITNKELIDKKKLDEKNSKEFIEQLYDKNDTTLSWESLIKDCGSKVMVENSAKGIEIFQRKYYKKKIKWQGYFISAFVQRIAGFVDENHLVNLNIRMIPSETIKEQDLILSLNHQNYHKYLEDLKLLKTGSPIEFEAIFEEIGDEWKPHHLHLVTLKLIDDFIADKEKVMLFKGINFDIEGHIKIEKEIDKIIKEDNENLINDEKDLNLTLEEENDNDKDNKTNINYKENKNIEQENNMDKQNNNINQNNENQNNNTNSTNNSR